TYNTPAIGTLFLMNEQMKLLNRIGYAAVQAEARRKAKLMYDWAEAKSYLSAFVRDPSYRSQAVATIDVSEKFKVEDLTKVLRAQNAAIDIDAYRKLGRNQLRIALFHNVAYEDLEKLTRIISLAIETA
ncbi:MAG: aminotransferase class V-fold PLP-dependent enzyme, partial [Bacteriovoracia bacterium]